jgi:tetratricopeptide (TPR) repeat protein
LPASSRTDFSKLIGPKISPLALAIALLSEALSRPVFFPNKIQTTTKGGNMRPRSTLSQGLSICALAFLFSGIVTATQDKPKVSEAESKASKAVESATDINAKMVASEEFVKKYPKSTLRQQLAEYVADQILAVSDPNQKLTLAQKFPTIFTEKAEIDAIKPVLIDTYLKLKRFDDAFAEGAAHLEKNADDIQILVVLAIAGVEQAKARNPKFVNASRQYGARAIELFEGDKKPVNMDADFWTRQKASLPQIYQEMAVISLMEQNPAEARAKLEKAAKLNPRDPFNFVMLGGIVNDEYQKMAQTYTSMPAGKGKEELLAKINVLLDQVIDHYAHSVGLSEGKPEYQQFHDQLLQDVTSYYRYRHPESGDGLKKLIDSYKQP